MKFRLILLSAIGLWTSICVAADMGAAQAPQRSDVRVLIDISGSMKDNDPNNLRIPALRLITQLIPEGQQAGVWTFGQYVNMLVRHGEVDDAWKEQAYQAAGQINSKGLFTNIEAVLEKSTWDWKAPDPAVNRSIIFLTDGVVDVSKEPGVNEEARARILNETVPRLKQAGATIHTIALSDDADKAFLRQLASTTEGWNEIAEDASQLERIFLKLFEKSVPVETLPLTDNRVLVDDSIRELTLLIFKKPGSQNAALRTPSGEKIDYRSEKENVRWRHEERYDLITIDAPMAGEWGVDAELDPDNRVMVVTDLKVRASRLPNVMMAEDVMSYYVELEEGGEVIRKPEFLDFVHISLERSSGGGQQKHIPVKDDSEDIDRRAHDGRFSAKVGGQLTPGDYEYELVVDGMTFKRSKRDTVKVVDKPVAVTVKEEQAGDPAQYSLTLVPFAELIKPDSLLIDATVAKQGGAATSVTIPRTGPSEWRLDMKVSPGDIYDVRVEIQAERQDGRQGGYDLGSFVLGGGSMDVAFDEADEPPAEVEAVIEQAKADAGLKPTDEEPPAEAEEQAPEEAVAGDEAAEESPNWIMVAVKVIGLNGVLIGIGFFVYRRWFRTPRAKQGEEKSDGKEVEQ